MASEPTRDQVEAYLVRFHSAYVEGISAVPPDLRPLVKRYAVLGGHVRACVTRGGNVAYRYDPPAGPAGEAVSIEVVEVHERVGDWLIGLPSGLRHHATTITMGTGSFGSGIEQCRAGRFEIQRGTYGYVADCLFRVGPGFEEYVYLGFYDTCRDSARWDPGLADRDAMAEILDVMKGVNRIREAQLGMSNYLADIKERTVLLLGDFAAGERERLDAMAEALKRLEYRPLFVDEVADPLPISLTQKAVLLATMSRFSVADNSSRAGHLTELALLDAAGLVTAVLEREGTHRSAMTRELGLRSSVVKRFSYADDDLNDVVREACGWAEDVVAQLITDEAAEYGWRASQGIESHGFWVGERFSLDMGLELDAPSDHPARPWHLAPAGR